MSTASTKTILLAAVALALAACDAPQPQPAAKAVASKTALPHGGRVLQAEHGMLWRLTEQGLFLEDPRSSQRLAIALPEWQWAAAPYACMPDLALGPKGELIVTSNVLPKLWRVDPDTQSVTVHPLELDADQDKDVGFAGLLYSDLHQSFFAVSQLHGSLWMVDPLLRRGRKIALEDAADSSVQQETVFIRAACPSTAARS